MNGPEHYREAESLIDGAARMVEAATENTIGEVLGYVAPLMARAQVHATLALTAATVRPAVDQFDVGARAWAEATAFSGVTA